ncbi:MAG: hypothetical protein IJO76_04670 [Clostridia bacterium]|nr:hypothetical protein [Clostridia bacterium]
MQKRTYFFIDDVIWVFRDLTRQRPASLFDNPFMKLLREGHDRYGMKVQLNVFYRTDFFYGSDEFSLADMTDAYKAEFTAAADWLKFGFHAKQEFPDYPYINANYADVKADLEDIKREIFRFAGEKSFARAVIPHWLPISKQACQALHDGGIKLLSVSTGPRVDYNGDPASLPYGHAARLLQNRKPETALFTRKTRDAAITASLCGYNHIESPEPLENTTCKVYFDKETGLYFKQFGATGPCLNLIKEEELEACYRPLQDYEYVGYAIHEQYFYPDYYAYQPDYANKVLGAAKILQENGYTYFFVEELV